MQYYPESEYQKRAEEIKDQTLEKIVDLKTINT
jgi:hypothetical protein